MFRSDTKIMEKNPLCRSEIWPPTSISFVLKLQRLDLYVRFPHAYPSDKCAEILVRSNSLTRDNQSKLNKDLNQHLETIFDHSAIVSEAISWLQDNAGAFESGQDETIAQWNVSRGFASL